VRVVLDSNIFITAFRYGGKCRRLIEMGLDGDLEIMISLPILDETLRVLESKFNASPGEIRTYRTIIEAATTMIVPRVKLSVVEDPDDDKIVECGVSSDANAIITADKDLLRMGVYDSIRMFNPEEFYRLVLTAGDVGNPSN
jgi:uncharacterized protein